MKKLSLFTVLLLLFFSLPSASAASKKAPPKADDAFPAIALPMPQSPEHQNYLGLSGDKNSFAIQNIQTKVLIIEIFSMYCPHCQREAPEVNALYRNIRNNADLADSIKIIGIGVGNTAFEVDVFRKKYDIAFPLFADPEFTIYERLGSVRTPYFFVLTITENGPGKVIYAELGGIDGAKNFLEKILHLTRKPGDK
ncbi:MAG TPA: TlpA disulfide reductase family protein [Desulfosalsimonadaceae bacterium]|nr:TlpA disulfide reductase family protein [Desulfosalsimonadaceae bacterium]